LGQSNQAIQAKLRVGPVDDPLEREADRVADAVVGGDAAGSLRHVLGTVQRKCDVCAKDIVQRKCEECEQEEKEETVRRAADGTAQAATPAQGGAEAAAAAVASGGAPLPADARSYFEPRFGRDLSDVRIHADGASARAAQAIDARAYTLGNHIAFAPGEYAPSGRAGAHLLAHELAHVAQQKTEPAVRRTPTASSSCPANTHSAPADPMAELTAADERAQLMTLGCSHLLFVEALTRDDPTLGGPSPTSEAYLRRFDHPPPAPNGRFRNRFDNKVHATENEAIRAEMLFLSRRYERLHRFIAGNIRYRCPGTSAITLPGCASFRCGANTLAFSCPGGRQIAICPSHWTYPLMASTDQRGGNIIHESVHMNLQFLNHNKGSPAQRARNSECYAAFVADIYGFVSDDSTDCTPVP
jgi:hypothetical protein